VDVVRGRAEEPAAKKLSADVVTGRAVASLSKLISWCWPLVKPGGQILMIKGQTATEEVEAALPVLRRKNLQASVLQAGAGVVDPLTTAVKLVKN
jgi:16S rRNA (guanine527-N7)-methyltransferase